MTAILPKMKLQTLDEFYKSSKELRLVHLPKPITPNPGKNLTYSNHI